ncbi:unnamed protein product [Symbiodinium sp. CCMP2592]|nr:unnamed protein product [Symbiodinium sp. CCMP2592]
MDLERSLSTFSQTKPEDVINDIKKAFCENFEIEYKVKGKKGALEHPCCTEAKTCFGKAEAQPQTGMCQAECTVEALAGITSRGIKQHERFWAPRACVTLPEEKTLVAQQTSAAAKDIEVVADDFRDSVRELGKLDMKVFDDHLTERLHVVCGN